MKVSRLAFLLLVALGATANGAVGATVDLSMNVFPTTLALPNNGGTWRIVAKTNAPLGIAAISAYLKDVNIAGIGVEPDIGSILNGGQPFVGVFNGAINILYGQDTASGPIVVGVGTPSTSDGPDPLGDPTWDGATRIFSGAYSGAVPSFTAAGMNITDANVLIFTTPGNPAQDADTSWVVRVAVPEPTSVVVGVMAVIGALAACRRR